MACEELEKRYKNWCKDATRGKVPWHLSNGLQVTVAPLFRNVPTSPLVVRTEQGSVLAMQTLPSIIRDTARRIDANAASIATNGQQPGGEQMLALTVKELSRALANLGAHALDKNVIHGLGLHLLPLTIGNWVYKIRPEEATKVAISTEKLLLGVFEKIHKTGRFCHITVHKSYVGLSVTDTARSHQAQTMLQFKDTGAQLMRVLGNDLDTIDLEKQSDSNVLGSYLCRTSMIQKIEGIAWRALQNFGLFTPEAPLDHILATRLYEASRVYGSRSRYPIRRFAGKSEPGPVLREFPGLLARAKDIIRQHDGMMQVTSLLVQLVANVLHVKDRRDGPKEKGMLHNLRHATAVAESNELMFFLNATRADEQVNQQIFAPPVLSEFDLRENSSGQSKPSWAKSLLELERLTGHDTIEDTKGSAIVTMAGFPYQCTFVLERKLGEGFFYCPHRFSNRQDAIEHVKAVHKGEELTEEIIMKIAQVDDQLESSAFGKTMEVVNEVAKLRQLELDVKDPEKLRRRPTLHADVHEMSRVVTKNTMILERLRRDRDEAITMLQSLDRSTKEGEAISKRQVQLLGVRNRAVTDIQKRMLAPSTLASLQKTWEIAKARKAYVTGDMYKAFMESKDQLSILDTTLGAEARQYDAKVKAMGGVDPGAIPAGIPGGGIRVDRANVSGIIAQDLIERSRYIDAVEDANQALIAANRDATFLRVVSENDIDFGASNVLPAATPVLAADGWDDEVVDESGDQDVELELEPASASTTTTLVEKSNPLKRRRPKEESSKDKGLVALLSGDGVLSTKKEAIGIPEKVQVILSTVKPFLQNDIEVELERVIRIRGLKGSERISALERDMHLLNMAFHPRMRDTVDGLSPKNALRPGDVRTLMDPLRMKVSVLVLTDPRLIRCPNGVLMRKLSACVTLNDAACREYPDDEDLLCSVLADGICTLLQPKFLLSVAGLDLVTRALKCVLLEKIGSGRDGNWEVVCSLVEALNGNLQGFWNAAYLRRYHAIQDPSHKIRHVDRYPEKTYAPADQLPSLNAVIARMKNPIVALTSPLSVSPSESCTMYSKLRVEEVKNLTKQVTSALSEHKADLVKIVHPEGLDAKSWIDRLAKGNVNAFDNPHAMCTWFRDTKATASECRDEEKHQWLREAYCCICSELLASAPFEGWCCLSRTPSLDVLLNNALRDVTDPISYTSRRDSLRQSLVNTVISQPQYPSFHFWHRHCKKADDNRLVIESMTIADKSGGGVKNLRFDECPLCRTRYPREKRDLPSMSKIRHKIGGYTKLTKDLVKPEARRQKSITVSNLDPPPADQEAAAIRGPVAVTKPKESTSTSDPVSSTADQGDTTIRGPVLVGKPDAQPKQSTLASNPGPSTADQETTVIRGPVVVAEPDTQPKRSAAVSNPRPSLTDQGIAANQDSAADLGTVAIRESVAVTESNTVHLSTTASNPRPPSADEGVPAMQEPNHENTNEDVIIVPDDDTNNTDDELQLVDVARTGVAYLGALFQKDTGCANSPALLFPPSPRVYPPEHPLTLFEEIIESSSDSGEAPMEMATAVESIRQDSGFVTSGAENPMDITTINSLLNEIAPLNDIAEELQQMITENKSMDPDGEALIRSLLNMEDNRLLGNIEASALDREVEGGDNNEAYVESLAPEPVAMVDSLKTSGAKVIGGSGACHQRGCKACPYLMPRTNVAGTKILTVPIDCRSRDVVYASFCITCNILHGMGYAKGSFKEEIILLARMSSNRQTLCSRCAQDHAPNLVGLDTFTTEEDAKAKLNAWKAVFKQSTYLDLRVI